MANSKPLVIEAKSSGDRAVDGLLAGLAAGLVMAAYLLALSFIREEGPAVMFDRFIPDGMEGSAVIGVLLQLAIAAICGALFGLVESWLGRRWPRRLPIWLVGVVYSLLLLVIAQTILVPATAASFREIPVTHLALAHGLYGLVLGWLIGQNIK